ncbi:hypothetical protein N0389_30870, partial [Pseudomonas aeruginosa]|nr:hypothetical protein [Pseudomonas aeruginosa]
KWLAAISTAAHLIGRLPLKLTFSTESARSGRRIGLVLHSGLGPAKLDGKFNYRPAFTFPVSCP